MPVALIYCRQSRGRGSETKETSLSLDAQEAKAREWAEREGWQIQDVIRDHDLSGASMDRAGWQDVVHRVRTGGIDGVIVFASSRVARDNMLFEQTYRELIVHKCQIISVSEPGLSDDMMRGFLGLMSQAERKRMGRFISAAATERKRRGLWVGGFPFGFRKTGIAGERGRNIEPDPDLYPIVRELAERLLAGNSANSIARWLQESGVRGITRGNWRANTVRNWAQTPAIGGGIRTGDGVSWGHFPGIVTPDEFALIQHMLDATRLIRSEVVAESWLRGSLYHGCGRRMVVQWGTNNSSSGRWRAFRCQQIGASYRDRCALRPITCSATKIEAAAHRALALDLQSALTPETVQRAWHAVHGGAETTKRRSALIRDLGRATEAHNRAEALYLNGTRDALWLAGQDSAYAEKCEILQRDLELIETPPDRARTTAAYTFLTASGSSVDALNDDQLKQIIRRLGKVQMDGDQLRIEYNPEFRLLVPTPMVITWR